MKLKVIMAVLGIFYLLFLCGIITYEHIEKTKPQQKTLIYAGGIDSELFQFAYDYHGEGNAHYCDSLRYWYFYRDGQKCRLINDAVLKRWEEQ